MSDPIHRLSTVLKEAITLHLLLIATVAFAMVLMTQEFVQSANYSVRRTPVVTQQAVPQAEGQND